VKAPVALCLQGSRRGAISIADDSAVRRGGMRVDRAGLLASGALDKPTDEAFYTIDFHRAR